MSQFTSNPTRSGRTSLRRFRRNTPRRKPSKNYNHPIKTCNHIIRKRWNKTWKQSYCYIYPPISILLAVGLCMMENNHVCYKLDEDTMFHHVNPIFRRNTL
jgi:hypothetical protein